MCLTSDTSRPLRAKEDMICYKRYCIDPDDTDIINSYIVGTVYKYKRGMTIHAQFNSWKDTARWVLTRKVADETDISDGFIHVYATASTAMDCSHNNGYSTIYLCLIPKGTSYYKDTDDGTLCARKIKVIGIVKRFVRLESLCKTCMDILFEGGFHQIESPATFLYHSEKTGLFIYITCPYAGHINMSIKFRRVGYKEYTMEMNPYEFIADPDMDRIRQLSRQYFEFCIAQ